jgi:hypothetical protein
MLITAVVIVLNIILPSALLFWLYRSRAGSRVHLASIAALAIVVLVVLTLSVFGAWYVVGAFWPWLFAAALAALLIERVRRGLPAAWAPPMWSREFFLTGINLLLLGAWSLVLPFLARGDAYRGTPLHLSAPLKGATFSVMGGGANWSVNHHYFWPELRYALDVVQVNALGFRAPALVVRDVQVPFIFGAEIVAPCSGEVIAMQDGLPNRPLMDPDVENRHGNHVIVFCQGHSVLLAHMRPGTVAVRAGDHVTSGQRLGEVGNSGSTMEPHLHIHAVEGRHEDGSGTATPLLIEGDFLVKGDAFKN